MQSVFNCAKLNKLLHVPVLKYGGSASYIAQ